MAQTLSPGPPKRRRGSQGIPAFIRPMAKSGIERFAAERGYPRVDEKRARRGALAASGCRADEAGRPGGVPTRAGGLRAALRRLLEPDLPLQPGLRALLPRRRRPRARGDDAFADRRELTTPSSASGVIEEIAGFAPEALTILTGGEPLLRRDILPIVKRAHERGLWVVVGTNGVSITERLARAPRAGRRPRPRALARLARCPDPRPLPRRPGRLGQHGARGEGARRRWACRSSSRRRSASTTSGELEAIAEFARNELAAKVWNLYFLVQTGRGAVRLRHLRGGVRRDPRRAVPNPAALRGRDAGQREVRPALRAQPVLEKDPESPFLKDLQAAARRLPRGDALPRDPAERGCHPLPLPTGLRRQPAHHRPARAVGPLRALRPHPPPATTLGGRCGPCEFNPLCGGCRARAYGTTGDSWPRTRCAATSPASPPAPSPCVCCRSHAPSNGIASKAPDDRVGLGSGESA